MGQTLIRTSSRLPQQQPNFYSARTAWILSLLLLVTFIIQVILIAFHDDFVLQLNTWEGELAGDVSSMNPIVTDAIDAAYEYNDRGSIDDTAFKYYNYSMEPKDILNRAGIDSSSGFLPSVSVREAMNKKQSNQLNQRREAELPTLDEIQSMYGNRPYILGLDRCEEFRDAVQPEHRVMGPAGMFNSATNLLANLLKLNCVNNARLNARKYKPATGMLQQAPWGKHNPVTWRLHHEAAALVKGINQPDFLPIVMIKDPITWMASMCRHGYELRWRHRKEHCPNLVPNKWDKGRISGEGTMKIMVKFATKHIGDEPIPDSKNKTFVKYNSMVELWNEWYGDWRDAKFPRLMVRFEDLLFHAEETVSQVCACGGGTMKLKFRYVEDSAKGDTGAHSGCAGFLASLMTYGNSTLRNEGILTDMNDASFARQHLDKELMHIFRYAPI